MVSVHNFLKKSNDLTALLIIIAVLFSIFITSGSLFSGYHFIDDDFIVSVDYLLQKNNFIEELFRATINEFLGSESRFRPLFYFHAYLETKVFGTNLFLWSLYTGVLSTITTYFLFIFARLIQLSFKEALLFCLLSILGPQLDIGYRLLDNETMGMFWLSVTLIFIVLSVKPSRHRILYELVFIISTFLMSLSKESFIILIPAIGFIKIWQFRNYNNCLWTQAIKNNAFSLLIIFLIFSSEILYIKYFIGTTNGYAGFTGLNFIGVLKPAFFLANEGYLSVIIISFILSILITYKTDNFKLSRYRVFLRKILFSPIFLLFLLIVVPQVLLYAKSGFSPRYLVPGILGYSIVVVHIYNFFIKKSKNIGRFIFILIIISLTFKYGDVWKNATHYSMDSKIAGSMFNLVEKNTVTSDPILIVANPFTDYEWTSALKIFLNYLEKRNNLYLVTYGSQRSDFFTKSLYEEEKPWLFLDPAEFKNQYQNLDKLKEKERIRCIIMRTHLRNDFLKTSSNWFQLNGFNEYVFNDFSFKDYIKEHIFHLSITKVDSAARPLYYIYIKK